MIFLIETYEVKYGFATGLLLYVPTLKTMRKVHQANRTTVLANVTLLNALVLVLQELTFHPFDIFLFFLLKMMIFASGTDIFAVTYILSLLNFTDSLV